MEADPALDAHAQGRDLVLAIATPDPDADPALAALAFHVELSQGLDQPFLQVTYIGAHVRLAALQVEHGISHALPGAVIGELAAAAGAIDRKAGLDQIFIPGAGPGCVDGGMLQQPDLFARFAFGDGGGPGLHFGHGVRIGDRLIADPPFDVGAGGLNGRVQIKLSETIIRQAADSPALTGFPECRTPRLWLPMST